MDYRAIGKGDGAPTGFFFDLSYDRQFGDAVRAQFICQRHAELSWVEVQLTIKPNGANDIEGELRVVIPTNGEISLQGREILRSEPFTA
jgi:hypothetical protein